MSKSQIRHVAQTSYYIVQISTCTKYHIAILYLFAVWKHGFNQDGYIFYVVSCLMQHFCLHRIVLVIRFNLRAYGIYWVIEIIVKMIRASNIEYFCENWQLLRITCYLQDGIIMIMTNSSKAQKFTAYSYLIIGL